jgi:hypothetical protein
MRSKIPITLLVAAIFFTLTGGQNGGTPTAKDTPSKYVFEPSDHCYAEVFRKGGTAGVKDPTGLELWQGHLDRNGSFWPNPAVPVRGFSAGIRHMNTINEPKHKNEEVYEYRSGRLIKGNLDEDGNFIPVLGSTVTDFKDFQYSPKCPRIYNLPGEFVPVKAKKDG